MTFIDSALFIFKKVSLKWIFQINFIKKRKNWSLDGVTMHNKFENKKRLLARYRNLSYGPVREFLCVNPNWINWKLGSVIDGQLIMYAVKY